MNQRLRTAILGCGGFAQRHARTREGAKSLDLALAATQSAQIGSEVHLSETRSRAT